MAPGETLEIHYRLEMPTDRAAIRAVLRDAFDQDAEGQLVDALRDQGYARLALVATEIDELVGYILFSHTTIQTADASLDALALAPLAVTPSRQGRGIGSALVREGLSRCTEQGHRIVLVVGHPAYYPRFGFSAELALPLASPYAGPSFMALELVAGALSNVRGTVQYPAPFSAF